MIAYSRQNKAFTIVELLIVIIVIGILASLGIYSYAQVQTNARDSKRASSISTIAEALENYYKKNGEYPSCSMMSQSADDVASSVLSKDITKDVLAAPRAAAGTNSIQAACADLNASSGDLFSYIGDTDPNCTTGSACSKYVLKYIEEGTGNVVTVKSRYGNEESFVRVLGGANSDSAKGIVQATDGSYFIASESGSFSVKQSILLSKYDSNGSNVWNKNIEGLSNIYIKGVSSTSDKGCVVVGFIYGGAGGRDGFIVKFNQNGDISWKKTWGGTDGEYFNSITQLPDGGYIAVGATYFYNTNYTDTLMVRFDASGGLVWNKTWGGSDDDELSSVALDGNNSLVVAGFTESYESDGILMQKINLNGDILWTKMHNGANDNTVTSLIRTDDGGYAIAGRSYSFVTEDDDILLMKFNQNGDVLWAKTWGNSQGDEAVSVLQFADDSYSVLGTARVVDAGQDDVVILKYDELGVLISNKGWSGSNHDDAYAAIKTNDGGFALVGRTQSFEIITQNSYDDSKTVSYKDSGTVLGASTKQIAVSGGGGSDGFFLKVKPSGIIEGCSASLCNIINGSSNVITNIITKVGYVNTNNPAAVVGDLGISGVTSVQIISTDVLNK